MYAQVRSKWCFGIMGFLAVAMIVFNFNCSKEGPGSNSGTTQSAPASSQSSTATPVPVANPTKDAPLMTPESVIAPGMNPPHGQPGHRCDIAVGAPLDSPPGKQPTPPATGGK